jgi:hypothetical protein
MQSNRPFSKIRKESNNVLVCKLRQGSKTNSNSGCCTRGNATEDSFFSSETPRHCECFLKEKEQIQGRGKLRLEKIA